MDRTKKERKKLMSLWMKIKCILLLVSQADAEDV